MHYYQKNIGDYRKDTCHLTLLEHGIYNTVMDEYYLNEKPIKTQSVIRRLSIKTDEEKEALNNVLNDFFIPSEDGESWIHERINSEISKYHHKSLINKNNGKLGGRPKKTQSVNSGLPSESESKANQKATNNQEPLTNNQVLLSDFSDEKPDVDKKKTQTEVFLEQVWKMFPPKSRNRSSMKKLTSAWKAISPKPDKEEFIENLTAWTKIEDWSREGGQYINAVDIFIRYEKWRSKPIIAEVNTGGRKALSETTLTNCN